MKKNNLKDALREAIAFAWSLIELLFTRILPLAGLLLLQFCRLLASSFFAAAGSHQPQADYSSDVQPGEFIEDDYVQVLKEGGDDQNELMSLKSIDKLEGSLTHDERHSETSVATAMPAALEVVASSTSTDVAPEVVTESEVVAKEMKVRGSDHGYVAAKKLDPAFNVLSEEEQRGMVNQEGSIASDVKTTGRTGGEMRKRNMPRVLPPSPSQVKRTILALSKGKGEAPLPYQPSPTKKMKKQTVSPRSHNRVSPTLASSSSYDNFMGKFRNHFLLDPALFM